MESLCPTRVSLSGGTFHILSPFQGQCPEGGMVFFSHFVPAPREVESQMLKWPSGSWGGGKAGWIPGQLGRGVPFGLPQESLRVKGF